MRIVDAQATLTFERISHDELMHEVDTFFTLFRENPQIILTGDVILLNDRLEGVEKVMANEVLVDGTGGNGYLGVHGQWARPAYGRWGLVIPNPHEH